jgi:hypothetical protein
MSDLREKTKTKIDATADAAKQATDKVIDKSKDAAHTAGKILEKQGKRLQNV